MRKFVVFILATTMLFAVVGTTSYGQDVTCTPDDESTITQTALDAYEISDWQTALEAYDCLVQLNPNDARIINTRGFLHYQLETPDTAVSDFERAIDLDPSFALPYANLGFVHLNFDEDPETALDTFTRAVELDLDLVNGYFGRAQAYGQLELYAQARADLLTAIALTEEEDAFLLGQLGAVEQALEEIELDESIASVQGGFSVDYPSDLLMANSQPGTPENVTMANDFGVFTPQGIAMSPGDVIVVVDFGDSQSVGGVATATAQEAAENITALALGESSPVTRITAGRHSGFTFTSNTGSERYLRQMVFDVDGGLLLSITSMHTLPEASEAFIPIMLAMVESVDINTDLIDTGNSEGLNGTLNASYVNPEDGFTLLHPQGWLVDTALIGEFEFIAVTPGTTIDLENPPQAGSPTAVIAYGTITELTGISEAELDPETDVVRVVSAIIGVDPTLVQVVEVDGLVTGLFFEQSDTFDNLFAAIILDDNFFVATNAFTASGADAQFFDIVLNMLQQVSFSN